MTNLTRNGILALGAAAMLVAGPAHAQATKESLKCASAKLKLYGKDLASQMKCIAKGAGAGVAVETECISKVVTKTAESFAKIELKGGCATDASTPPIDDGSLPNTRARLDAYLAATAAALVPNPLTASKCQASKVNAVGKLVSALFGCESKAAGKNVAVDQVQCVQKSIDAMKGAFAKAETKPPCDTTGDADGQVAEASDVTRVQTVYTPRFDGCGNRLTLAPETCDDGNTENFDFCPSTCQIAFCAPVPGSTRTAVLVTSRPDLSSITVNLDYPEDRVSLPGIGGDIPAGIITGPGTATTQPNDFEHALRLVAFDVFNFGTTTLATIRFDGCAGLPPPLPQDFACRLEGDATDENFAVVPGVTCSVRLP